MSDRNQLLHYGKRGMKWGIINEDGPVGSNSSSKTPTGGSASSSKITAAKKNIADRAVDLKKATSQVARETGPFRKAKPETILRLKNAALDLDFAKRDLNAVKILEKSALSPKSKYRLKMEEVYKKKGMTDDEASVAAHQNIRTKKVLAAVAGTALVVAVAYGAYKLHDDNVDKIIKQGSKLKNVSTDGTVGIRDAFYSSNNRIDNAKYLGLYGSHLNNSGAKIFQKEITALSDIRQASPKNAKRIFEELVKGDPDFTARLLTQFNVNPLQSEVYIAKTKDAIKNINAGGKISTNTYEVFNANLVDHDPIMQNLTDKYYKKMVEAGYNAIRDTNDQKYSGYNTINPMIIFNTNGKTEVTSVTELAKKELHNKRHKVAIGMVSGEVVKMGGAVAGGLLALNGYKKLELSRHWDKQVSTYKIKHPNTSMSNTEIARMLERTAREKSN